MNEIDLQPLAAGLTALGLAATPAQLAQFRDYAALLLQWNEQMNLTAVRTAEGIVRRHFLDSLSLVQVTGELAGQRLVDVGSGAGFPGLPLKILFPTLKLTLVESVAKKARFLEAVVGELGLTDVTVLVERAEQVGQMAAHREQYDWAVARAVAELRVLLEYLLPLCRVGGRAVAMKGASAAAELTAADAALATLGGGTARLLAVQLPGLEGELTLVEIPKLVGTPAAYPRRPGRPAKKPL